MQQPDSTALEFLKALGSVDHLQRLADRCDTPPVWKTNLHIHLPPNFSAFESVAQAVSLADRDDVKVLGASNYYDFAVYEEFSRLTQERGIFPVFGLEIIVKIDELADRGIRVNDPGNPGKMYICGRGITRFAHMTRRARQIIETIRTADRKRAAEMIDALADHLRTHGLDIAPTEETIIDNLAARYGCDRSAIYLQERHIAQAFQEQLFDRVTPEKRRGALSGILTAPSRATPDDPVAFQHEIRKRLMKTGTPCFVEESFISFQDAYELICELGGVPCYPVLADGVNPICEYEQPVDKLIGALKENNIHMAEFIPIRNRPSVLTQYVTAMHEAGIVVSGGTEHNTLEMLPIEPTCLGGEPIPLNVQAIFRQGACIVAAHQFLTTNGLCGYVDTFGQLSTTYPNQSDRIGSLARLGIAVLRHYAP